MDVVRHDAPCMESIPQPIEVQQRVDDKGGDPRILEERGTGTPVEIGVEPIGVVGADLGIQTAHFFDSQEDGGRQRVEQPERDEIGRLIALPMG
jgi:hypothetical protein